MKFRLVLPIILLCFCFPGVVWAASGETVDFSRLYSVQTFSQGSSIETTVQSQVLSTPGEVQPTDTIQPLHPALSFATTEVVPEAGFEGKLEDLLSVKNAQKSKTLWQTVQDVFTKGHPMSAVLSRLKSIFSICFANLKHLFSQFGRIFRGISEGVVHNLQPVFSVLAKLPAGVRSSIKNVAISATFLSLGLVGLAVPSSRAIMMDAAFSIFDLGLRVIAGAAGLVLTKNLVVGALPPNHADRSRQCCHRCCCHRAH
jgi:hypothetical protein